MHSAHCSVCLPADHPRGESGIRHRRCVWCPRNSYGVPGIHGVPGIPRHRRDPSVVVDGAVEPPLQNGRVIIRIGSRLEDVSLLWFRIKRVFGGVKYPPGASNRRVVFFASRSGG
jgi:hypothetical protein